VCSATARKPRTNSDTLYPIVAALQQAGQRIPIKGIAGSVLGDVDPIGDIDPNTLQILDGMGIYCCGRMFTERAEAIETLRSIKSGHIAVEYPPDLSELVLHRNAEVRPPPNPSFSEQLEQLQEVADAMRPEPGEPVCYRDRIQVEVNAGLMDEDVARTALSMHDLVAEFMNAPHPTKTADELRADCARIQREMAQ
jgi:hypothetical protein